jgi:hypothetical protein
MLSSTRFLSRLFTLVVLAAGTAAMSSACSLNLNASFDLTEGTGTGTGGGGGTIDSAMPGATGSGAQNDIPIPPQTTADGHSSYIALCGGGGCFDAAGPSACSTETNPDGIPLFTCQVVPTLQGPSPVCVTPGTLEQGAPCVATQDCKATLGCARTEAGGGTCLPYCCGDVEACAKGSYCAPRPIYDDVISPKPLPIPVCLTATSCTLLDDTTCPDGKTCTLVRPDGTTSCVTPGPCYLGDSCPCAAGHVCAMTLNKCLALCQVGKNDCPVGMICQAGAKSLPDGIGICVN